MEVLVHDILLGGWGWLLRNTEAGRSKAALIRPVWVKTCKAGLISQAMVNTTKAGLTSQAMVKTCKAGLRRPGRG